jgi:hypothetical protein
VNTLFSFVGVGAGTTGMLLQPAKIINRNASDLKKFFMYRDFLWEIILQALLNE